jgi:heme-degrading monooxygenase HmoA
MADAQCTAIVAYEVHAEDSDKFLNAWKQANDYLREQPGFLETKLYKAASANPDFRFVNIGCWSDEDAFRSATQSIEFKEAAGPLEAYPIHASVYEVTQT